MLLEVLTGYFFELLNSEHAESAAFKRAQTAQAGVWI